MGIVQNVNKRTFVETSVALADLSEYLSTSYPAQVATIRSLELHNRDYPYKKATAIDLSYTLDGLFMDDDGTFDHVRNAFKVGERVKIMCLQTDAAFWILGDFILPDLTPGDDPDFYPFSISAEAAGSNQFAGHQLQFASPPVGIARTGVPVAAKAMIAIIDAGTLTALRLRYSSGGVNYDAIINSPSAGINVIDLAASGVTVPASASAGNFILTPTPANASYEALVGYGEAF